ncbi:MAG: hypothetical protein JWO11_1721 [Nocardioides sp.]|nr:hypothetical protein [Nocardioides sp.]
MRILKGRGRSVSDARQPRASVVPISLLRVRVKLCVLAALTAAGVISGVAIWVTLAMTLACLAVPLAVATLGGAELVRALFLIPRTVNMESLRKDVLA